MRLSSLAPIAISAAAFVLAAAEQEVSSAEVQKPVVPWSEYFTQTFYHMTMLPLFALTVVLAWLARPSTTDELPESFRKFQFSYLSVWSLCVAADWLQGPYVYALYAAYGFSSAEVAQLFVAGFGSSLVFGAFVGTFTDRFGRKRCCLLYCVLYIMSCITKHFSMYSVLMLGRVTGGIATSMLYSCFECWMVSEHTQRHRFSGGLLGYMFGLMFTCMYIVAIASGLIGQLVADTWTFAPISEGSVIYSGGYCCPFDCAILCLIVGMGLITATWEENYGGGDDGSDKSSLTDNLKNAGALLITDKKILLLGVIVASFEGSMFAFVFNWTPVLASKEIPPPHGVIFAMFMMACMCGASVSTMVGGSTKPPQRLLVAFGAAAIAFGIASNVDPEGSGTMSLMMSFGAFLTFEFCVGLYFPSIGVLKSDVVPEAVRGTMYNMYRIPLNAIVVCLLLGHLSFGMCFRMCAVLMVAAFASISMINSGSPLPAMGDDVELKAV